MKKRIWIVCLMLAAFSAALTFGVSAYGEYYSIIDEAGLLTEAQLEELNARADAITQRYECEVVFIFLEDMSDYGDDDAYECAEGFRVELGYGYGDDGSCAMMLLSMADRDYGLLFHGFGNTAFTEYGRDELLDTHLLPLLGEDEYYKAVSKYLDVCEQYLRMARDGKPFDWGSDPVNVAISLALKLAAIILVPALIAWIVCSRWKRQMKTAVIAKTAHNYIPPGGFALTNQSDVFLYRTQTSRRIESASSSSGSSRRSSGSGSTGRSGKF